MENPDEIPGLSARRRAVVAGADSQQLSHLDLRGLREYRGRLEAEEEMVSYWRRLVHARIDLLDAESTGVPLLSHADLVRVLSDTGSGRARRALVALRPSDPWPELPELEEMWRPRTEPGDGRQVDTAAEALSGVESQLTEYRRVLHERIDESTRELILRYRADPALAVALLPGA